MIRTEGLSKVFQADRTEIRAVENLDLQVREGEVFGFLGPNGAGKTTTVRMLACLIGPTRGRAWVNGLSVGADDRRIRAQVGILTESPGLYERLSARHNLAIFAELYDVKDVAGQVEKHLRLFDLWDRRDDAVGAFSKGMKQKLAIARALLHEPAVLFLDEPTAALDPEAAKTVRESIEALRGQGRTIFLCTHNLDEAERLCDRIAVFEKRLIALDTPEALRRRLFGRQTVVELGPGAEAGWLDGLAEAVRRVSGVEHVDPVAGEDAGRLVITLDDPATRNPAIVRALIERGADVQVVSEMRHSLEDVYLSLLRAGAGQQGGVR